MTEAQRCEVNETEAWWQAIGDDPLAAIQSPLYPLLTLEDPERWLRLEFSHADSWITDALHCASAASRGSAGHHTLTQLWTADCLEHVLAIFEEAHPGELRARQCVEARRRWARHELSNAEFWTYQQAASVIPVERCLQGGEYKIPEAAREVLDACCYGNAYNATQMARYAVSGKGQDVRDEAVWQFRRLIEYLQGRVPL